MSPLAPPVDQGVALPFVVDDPRAIDPAARIAPALSQALIKCREAGLTPERVLQVTSPDRPALPVDLRKWPLAVADALPLDDILNRPTESINVLATSLLFWDHVINTDVSRDSEQLIQQIHAVLSKGGVWYLADMLPAEMPAHWLFSYIPELWEWAHTRTRDLHALYQQIQAMASSRKCIARGTINRSRWARRWSWQWRAVGRWRRCLNAR